MPDVRPLASILRSLNFKSQATLKIDQAGLRVTVEEGRSLQAHAYIAASAFSSYAFELDADNPAAYTDVPPTSSSRDDSPFASSPAPEASGPPYCQMTVSLSTMIECLNIFGNAGGASTSAFKREFDDEDEDGGSGWKGKRRRMDSEDVDDERRGGQRRGAGTDDGKTTSLRLSYAGRGEPLVMLLEEGGIVTRCEITTYEPEGLLDLTFQDEDKVQRLIIKSEWLRDALLEVPSSSEKLAISFFPEDHARTNYHADDPTMRNEEEEVPLFRLESVGPMGITEMDYSEDKDVLEVFECEHPIRNSYKYQHILLTRNALHASIKTSIRTDPDGLLSFQFMIPLSPRGAKASMKEDKIGFVEFLLAGPPTSPATTTAPHRLKAVPSSRAGVADVPLSPTGQKRFYSVHDGLLAFGAKKFGSVDEIEDEVLREQEEEEKRLAAEAAAEAGDGTFGTDPHLDSRPRSPDSEDEVTRMLVPPRRTALADPDTKVPIVARDTAGAQKGADFNLYGFNGVDSGQNGLEGDVGMQNDLEAEEDEQDKDVDGLLAEEEDLQMVPNVRPALSLERRTQDATAVKGLNGRSGKKRGKKRKMETTDSEADQTSRDWRNNVSKLHPPHVWYTKYTKGVSAASDVPNPSSSASLDNFIGKKPSLVVLDPSTSRGSGTLSTSPRPTDLIGCTVTLTLPDSTTRTFSTPNIHASRRAARRTVFALAYESGVREEAARMRAELGWDAEAQEEKAEKERVRKLKGGERPWEALKAEQERWMAEPMKWRFETEELNSVHSCVLTVPISPSSPPLVFTTSQTFRSHREAKDAAARLALEADVPAQYEQAFKQRLSRDSGGYIQFGEITVADAAVADRHVEEEADEDGSERDGPLDSIALLNREVRAAFGGLKGWLDWKHKHAEGDPSAYLNTCAQQWTGNGSPLKFAYTIQPVEGSIVKQYGCTVTVFVNIGLSKSYAVDPSPEMTTRRAAKDAAVRLALKEHVLDLLMPAGFDPDKPLAMKRDVTEDAWAPKEPSSHPPSCVSAFNSDGLAGPLKPRDERILHFEGSIDATHGPAAVPSVVTADEAVEAVEESAFTPLPFEPFVAESEVDSGIAPAQAGTSSTSPATAAATSKKTNARSAQSPAIAAPFLATPPSARPSSTNAVVPEDALPGLKESAVHQLDKLCIARLGFGYLPEYVVRQSPETGLFAASVRIPLQASPLIESPFALHSSRPIMQQVVTFAVDFIYWWRTPAQEAVANLALTSDIVAECASKGTASATTAALNAANESQMDPQPVARPFVSIVEEEAPAAPAIADAQQVGGPPDPPSKKRDCPDPAEAVRPTTTREDSQEHVAKRAKLDVEVEKDVGEVQAEVAAAEGTMADETVNGGEGGSVEVLRLGCREILGAEAKVEPLYKSISEGSLFGATVIVPLDKRASDSRAFSLPALYASPDEAYEAIARIALQAGILDLLDSRVRPKVKPASSAKDRREGRGGKKQAIVQRTEEEQAALRRASYGGFGAATAYQLGKMRAEAEMEKTLVEEESRAPEPKEEATKEVSIEVEGNPLLLGLPVETKEEKVQGEAMKSLKAYFESRSLSLPTIHREPSTVPGKTTDRIRIWLIHEGLRFELPAAHPSKAEEKLASKVLKYLKEQEEATKKAAA
ncbi:Proteophosphoglycan ppg4 [Rhodotorula toruloides ATCC 204091]|uniref:BY PROTMAP: gi/342319821/gb/EGU11767.1/ Proteophosphoglycan ppg4 [Rhodotorula glutinis ATCC 204091] n=1 Tax=Rhodotorula toruloides TaxID=5286 RepID=A0A0K3CH38_RHOTO|nr:Proteophosphoglycan ppg4 [Rhodotorula toruloides ATCC 204091]